MRTPSFQQALLTAAGITCLLVAGCAPPSDEAKPGARTRGSSVIGEPLTGDLSTHSLIWRDGQPEMLVTFGSKEEAEDYYKNDVNAHLEISDDILKSDLNDLLTYCGYSRDAARLEVASSAELMRDTGIQATVFFAPKIVDVSGNTPFRYGWRKLLRLKARAKSKAEEHGIESLWLLFNFTSKDPVFPGGRAAQIQAILERPIVAPLTYPVYLFVYKNNAAGYGIGLALNASFDGAGVTGERPYFVPHACAQCHGDESSSMQELKINYLDTDHWFDRAQVSAFQNVLDRSVLPDGGTPGSTNFETAFSVYRTLNTEIQAQVRRVDANGFADKAVTKWLELHALNSDHVGVLGRALPGTTVWDPGNSTDAELLPLLNKYCYRCHSSVRYHVFDKDGVKQSFKFNRVVKLIEQGRMPQDRVLDAPEKDRLIRLAQALLAQDNP